MEIVNRSREHLTHGWLAGRFSTQRPGEQTGFDTAFIVKAAFAIDAAGRLVPREAGPLPLSGDLFIGGDPAAGLGYPSDFVPAKPRAEFMVVGTAHRPSTDSSHSYRVAVEVGSLRKELVVHGHRFWEPTLFGWQQAVGDTISSLPLTYANAFGGPGDPANPLGRGRVGRDMPFIELPGQPVTSPRSQAAPAGFAPLPAGWKQRRHLVGSFGDGWLKERWPWVPADFSPDHFLAAPQDQWLDGYLRGDERLLFEHFDDRVPELRVQLPGLRALLFVARKSGVRPSDPVAAFENVPLALDTLWIDLDQRLLVLAWRGIAPVASLGLRDIGGVMVMTEPLGSPQRPLEEYRALFEQEVAAKRAGTPAPAADRKQAKAVAAATAAELRESIRQQLVIPPELRQELEKMVADTQSQYALAGRATDAPDFSAAVATFDQKVAAFNLARDRIFALKRPTASRVEAILAETVGSQPEVSADTLRGELAAMLEGVAAVADKMPAELLAKSRAAVADVQAKQEELLAFRERLHATLAEQNAKIDAALPAWALREPLDPDEPIDLEAARRDGFAHMDLSDFDFSGLDLEGVSFRNAILQDARFIGARLVAADLSGANLTGTDFTRADLRGARLEEADLTQAVLHDVHWQGVRLARAKLSGLDLRGADFSGVDAAQADFAAALLDGAKFCGARLSRAIFTNAQLEEADFSQAIIDNAAVAGVHAARARFVGADITAWRAGQEADFSAAVFVRAVGPGSVWQDAVVDRANFSGAHLDRADFSHAFARQARFYRCRLADTTFSDAVLVNASFVQSKLLRASFARADLSDAVFDGANLFAAGLWSAVLTGTSFRGANVGRTTLASPAATRPAHG
jgi:uncharacterized protein YjbI with pentapeptide repeats